MRTYSVTTSRVFCVLTFLSFLSSAALTGCLSSGATPPGANAPCKINDDCPSGYQCRAATNGALGGPFCCKDKNNCGPAGSGGSGGGALDGGGSGIDGIAAMDGPSSKGGALDVPSSGGAGGSVIVDGGSGGAGGGITVVGGSTSGGGTAGGLATGGVAGNQFASGGVLTGGIASGGIVSGGGAGGALDAARDLPQMPDSAPDVSMPDAAADNAPDLPLSPPDGNGTCPTGEKACTSSSGTTCIATSACCVNADCAGTCQTCNTSHACVAAVSQDDPNGRCAGTCDTTGVCKSKKGQTCQTVAVGCASGTTCSTDGYCCDTACGQCNSCSTGTCTPLTGLPSCGTGKVCASGSCITCTQNDPCQPADPCKTGTISCATGSSVCGESGSQPAGTSCGTGKVCSGGNCQTGCWIGGAFIVSSATGASTCQVCNPAKSTTSWSNNDGATVACGSGGCPGSTAPCINGAPGTCSKIPDTYYQDNDGDGYGNPLVAPVSSCTPIAGWVTNHGDCSDADSQWYAGRTRCASSTDPNTLVTCNSDGTASQSSCSTGCAGGQCKSFATVGTAGFVTCGTLTCSTSQACSFVYPDTTPPSCGTIGASYFATCDGPNDCPSGQVCCRILPLQGYLAGEQTSCVASGSCPYGNMGGSGQLVCNPSNPVCPSGVTCQMATSFLSIYICKA